MIEILESIFLNILVGAIFVVTAVVTAGVLFFSVYTLVQVCQELVAVWEDFKRNRM